MSEISPLFTSTCRVLRDITVQELRTQNNFLRKQLESKKDLLLHLDVIITNHTDFNINHKEMKGIFLGNCENSRCNVLVKVDEKQYMIKQIFRNKIIFLCSKIEYTEFIKNCNTN